MIDAPKKCFLYGLWCLPLVGLYYFITPGFAPPTLPAPSYSLATLSVNKKPVASITLEDITLQAGIQRGHIQHSEPISGLHESLGAGACAFDYNQDGWVDLLVLNGSGTTHFHGKTQWWQNHNNNITLYKNNGDETFTDVTATSGLISHESTMGCAYGDIDNDGDADLFISYYGRNQLWANSNGKFNNITEQSGIAGEQWSTSVTMVDVNRDGLLDIFVNNFIDFAVNALTFEHHSGYEATLPLAFNEALFDGQANQLWINQGHHQFINMAKTLGIDNPQGRSLHAQWVDINHDTYPDLLVANGKDSSNKVFLNQEGKQFIDISLNSGLSFTNKAQHISVGDFDRDNNIDIVIGTDHTEFSKVYRQSPSNPMAFIDNSYQKLSTATTASQSQWASVVEDFDLDGWPDLYIANGLTTPNQDAPLLSRGQPDSLLLYHNRFNNMSQQLAPYTDRSLSSRCALATDMNNDGRADIYVSHNNHLGQLLKNTGEDKNWLGIELLSQTVPAIGAVVNVTVDDMTYTQHYGNKHSFLCTGDQRLRFGLGNVSDNSPTSSINIAIHWPDGSQQTLHNVQKNRYHRIQYGQTNTLLSPELKLYTSHIIYRKPLNTLKVIEWLIAHQYIDKAVKELSLLSHHSDNKIRQKLLHTASLLPEIHQLQFIQQAFNDQSIAVRLQAIALTRDNENELLARWLLAQLEHDHTDVICATTSALAHFYREEEAFVVHKYNALGALIRLLDTKSEAKQICAIQALGESEHYRALQPLLTLTENKYSEKVRIAAIQALALIKERAALPALTTIQKNIQESEVILAQTAKSIAIINASLNGDDLTHPFNNNRSVVEKIERIEKSVSKATLLDENTFYKTPPEFIGPLLEKQHSTRIALLKEIAKRKERWARDIIHTVLSDKTESVSIKTTIIKQLVHPLSPRYQQVLHQLQQDAIAQYQRLSTHNNHHEDTLMALAEMIYYIEPEQALEMVLH